MTRRLGALMAVCTFLMTGCFAPFVIEDALFPVLPPNPFDSPPIPPGPFAVKESRASFVDLGDGLPGGVTLYEPDGAGNGAAIVWVLGLNQRGYYQQSLHEHLASHGYTVVVPDARPYSFVDLDYHGAKLRAAIATVDRLVSGLVGNEIDPARIAVGGYEIGGPLAAFVGGAREQVKAVFTWAPIEPPFWMRLETEDELPLVTQPMLIIEGALDTIAPPGRWQAQVEAMAATDPATIVPVVLGQAVHAYFQEPVPSTEFRIPPTPITRAEQLARAIGATRLWLDFVLAPDPATS